MPGALGVSVVLNTVMLLWVFWTIHKDTPLRFVFDRALFKRMFRYGMKSHLQIIASHFNFKAGVYLCSYYLTPSEVAFYAIGAKFAEQMMSIPQSLGLAMFPRLAGMSEDRVHAMTAAACRQTLAIAVLAAIVLTHGGTLRDRDPLWNRLRAGCGTTDLDLVGHRDDVDVRAAVARFHRT